MPRAVGVGEPSASAAASVASSASASSSKSPAGGVTVSVRRRCRPRARSPRRTARGPRGRSVFTISRSCAGKCSTCFDPADLLAVADDVEADELVVVPGVVFGRILFGPGRPRGSPREPLGGGAVVDALEEGDGVAVHPAELAHRQALAVPRRGLGHLERERRAGHEAALGVVGVELELDGALQAVRLDEAADPQLRSWCVGHVSRRVATSTRTRRPSASAVMSVRRALAVRPPRPITRPRSSGCT